MSPEDNNFEYYRTYAAISLDDIEHNLSELKKKIKPGVMPAGKSSV